MCILFFQLVTFLMEFDVFRAAGCFISSVIKVYFPHCMSVTKPFVHNSQLHGDYKKMQCFLSPGRGCKFWDSLSRTNAYEIQAGQKSIWINILWEENAIRRFHWRTPVDKVRWKHRQTSLVFTHNVECGSCRTFVSLHGEPLLCAWLAGAAEDRKIIQHIALLTSPIILTRGPKRTSVKYVCPLWLIVLSHCTDPESLFSFCQIDLGSFCLSGEHHN